MPRYLSNIQTSINSLSAAVDVVSQAVSVVSQQVSVLSQAHSALSQQVSVLSSQVSTVSVAVTSVDSHVNTVSNQVSVNLSAVVNASTSGSLAALSITLQSISVLSQAVSVLSQQHSVLSQAHSVLSTLVSNNLSAVLGASTAGSIAALSIALQSISVISAFLVSLSARSVGNVSTHGLQSIINAISNRISGIAGGSVTSTKVSNLISGVTNASTAGSLAALSIALQSISVISQQVSVISAFLVSLSARSVGNVSTHGLQSILNALSNRISAGGGGAGSVTSNELSAVSAQAASALSQALSVGSVTYAALSDAISNMQSLISVAAGMIISLQNNDASAVSAGCPVYLFTSANTFKRCNGSAIGSVTMECIGLVLDASIAVSALGRVQTGGVITLTTGQWDAITGGSGGLTAGSKYFLGASTGTLTATSPAGPVRPIGVAISSTQFMVLLYNVNGYSNVISVLSQQVSVLSQQVSVLSQAHSVLSQAHSVVSAGLGLVQMGKVTTSQLMSGTAFVAISGMSVSMAAGGTYQLDGRIMFTLSVLTGTAFTLSSTQGGAGLIAGVVRMQYFTSAIIASIVNITSAQYVYGALEATEISTAATAVISIIGLLSGGSMSSYVVEIYGQIGASAAGTLQFAAKQSASGGGMKIYEGSFIRAYRIT